MFTEPQKELSKILGTVKLGNLKAFDKIEEYVPEKWTGKTLAYTEYYNKGDIQRYGRGEQIELWEMIIAIVIAVKANDNKTSIAELFDATIPVLKANPTLNGSVNASKLAPPYFSFGESRKPDLYKACVLYLGINKNLE